MRAGAISLISSELLGDVEVYSEAVTGAAGGSVPSDVGVCGAGSSTSGSAGLRGGHCARAHHGHNARRSDRYRHSRFVYAEWTVYILFVVV